MNKFSPFSPEGAKLYRKKGSGIRAYITDVERDILTLNGMMHADVGDYITIGSFGEEYPVKPEDFIATFELVEEDK